MTGPRAEKDVGADVALAMFRRKYGREPVPESFDQSRLKDCRETVALIWPEISRVVAEAKAEALIDAAMEYGEFMYGWTGGHLGGSKVGGVPEWLRDRAASVSPRKVTQ